jgi:Flp pilus assembly protein CpaB
LAAAIPVKVTGYFNAPPTVAPAKPPEINVLVAARNLFKGDLIDNGWVQVRPLRPDELKDYEQNKDKYLPPVVSATSLRIAAQNIEADRPLLREHLVELDRTKPDPISSRLLPNMRAVNVSLSKEESAGGLIQTGEWVDVLFTTQITINGVSSTRTAAVAHKQRVIAKRNTLWTVLGSLPDDKPVHFTLEMNPYRAALLEYCRTKGVLTLLPVSSAEQKSLEQRRVAALNGDGFEPVAFAPPNMEKSAEYEDEDDRVDALNKGELNIGTGDLARIFNIQTKEPKVVTPAEKPITVQQLTGTKSAEPAMFNADGSVYENPSLRMANWVSDYNKRAPVALPKALLAPGGSVQTQSGVDLSAPEIYFGQPGEKPGCKNCKKKPTSSVP